MQPIQPHPLISIFQLSLDSCVRESYYVNWNVRGNFFVLVVNILEQYTPSSIYTLFSVIFWEWLDLERHRATWRGGWGWWAPEKSVGSLPGRWWCRDHHLEGRDTESRSLVWTAVRVLTHAVVTVMKYVLISFCFMRWRLRTQCCQECLVTFLSLQLYLHLLVMGNLPSFHVCFLPILGFGWFKHFNAETDTSWSMWPTPKTRFFSRSLLFRLQSPSAREESRWFT